MYEPRASADELSLFGLGISDFAGEEVEVWPGNWQAFRLFNAMSTQWRTGACGATGLDYTAIRDVASYIGINKRQIPEMFHDLQLMEAEALAIMAEA